MDLIYKVIITEEWFMAAITKKYYLQSDSNIFKVHQPNNNLRPEWQIIWITDKSSTVGIWRMEESSIWMVLSCPIAEWSGFQMPFE